MKACARGPWVMLIGVGAVALWCGATDAQSPEDLLNKVLPTPSESRVLHSRVVKSGATEVPLRVPEGFTVALFAESLVVPREMAQLPNGDVLVVESAGGRVTRFADRDADGTPEVRTNFAAGLTQPYGILYRDGFVYVANTDSVVRFPVNPDGTAGPREEVIPRLEFLGEKLFGGGHWTRDILFSRDGRRLYVAVGSRGNDEADGPAGRAAILEYDADGTNPRLFANGLRNPVSIALRPGSDEIWTTVNERDRLGNDLVPDFVTSVRRDGFYGWPFYYIGPNPDPNHVGARPDLAGKVIVPDVLIQSHSAPLGLTFYEGTQFPEKYRGAAFVGLHGSWNRDPMVGYKVVTIPFAGGKPAGGAEDFLTGFIKDEHTGEVYGRPVAPFVLRDGSLLVSDDDGGRVWRVTWKGH